MSLHRPYLNIEYRIQNRDNLKGKCEETLSMVSYNGDYKYNFFSAKREELNNVISKWQENYSDLYDELENWKFSDEGTRFTCKETVTGLHNGKNVSCVFLRIYDSGEPNSLYCISIFGDISIKVKVAKVFNKMLGWAGLYMDENEKRCIRMIKAHPKIMAALILAKDSGLRVSWED